MTDLERSESFKERGVTSLEMVSSVAILVLVGLVIAAIFLSTQVIWQESVVNVKIQDHIMRPMQTMVKELKEADPSSPIGVTIAPNQQSITFAVPDAVGSDEITSWNQLSFAFNSGTGEVTRTGADTSVIGRNVQDLQFSQSGNTLTIALEVADATAEGKTLTASATSQIAMRN